MGIVLFLIAWGFVVVVIVGAAASLSKKKTEDEADRETYGNYSNWGV
jgi:hypothetical protein